MIYTLTLNPSVDYITGVENFRTGTVNRSCYEKILPGGKGINVSIVLNNLGIKSCAMGFAGGFTGEYIKNSLENDGIETDFVLLKNGISRINTKIKSDEETELNASGPLISEDEKEILLKKLEKIQSGDILVLAGSVPRGFGKEFYSDIMKNLFEKNVKVIVDAEGELLKNTLSEKPFLVKPNNFELEGIFEIKIDSFEKIIEYGKKLREMGARNVLVSLGKDGGIFISEENECFYCEAPSGKVINTTGAGDSVVAGFISEICCGGSFKNAFLKGISSGSASSFSENLCKKDEVLSIFNKIKEKIKIL